MTSVEVSNGESVATNVPGDQLFLNSSGSLLGSIQGLITAIQNNSGIAAASTALGTAASTFDAQRVTYGTSLTQLQSTTTFLSAEQTQLSTQENNIDGADLRFCNRFPTSRKTPLYGCEMSGGLRRKKSEVLGPQRRGPELDEKP